MTTLRARSPRPGSRRRQATVAYINRELSWLDFNARVLHEARDERNPLLERAKFLAIFASNLDEFFQVRGSGLMEQVAAGSAKLSSDGRTAAEQLTAIRARVQDLVTDHSRLYEAVRAALARDGVAIVDHAAIPEHHARLRERYLEEIFPVLTPLAVAPGHPFPYISTLSLSLAITIADPQTGEQRYARVKVPPILPRLVQVESRVYVPLE
jgi:polyphosphate kinase